MKFWTTRNRRRQAQRSPWQMLLERLEDRTLMTAPTVANPLADQSVAFKTPFQLTVPSNTFTDADAGDTLTLSATGVPAWLTFVPGAASANPTGAFSGTPTASDVGTFNITVTATDSTAATISDTFKITIQANAVPSFTKGANQTALEDAAVQTDANWATNISQGLNESGQSLNFLVSSDNPGLFSVQPVIAENGTLTYTPAVNANGVANVTVSLHDSAGTTSGGVDTSVSQTYTITVTAVNDVPSFALPANPNQQPVLEDVGTQTVANFATVISTGTNDSGQTVDFLVSNDNPSYFSVQPAISASGTLTYTPAANANGTATIMVSIHDNGGTANGGVDTSTVPKSFTITITPVNDVPSFTKGQDQTVLEDAVAQSVSNWATNISVGPGNESTQTPDFQLTNNNNSLFTLAGQPAISSTGTLTYTLAPNANGTATVTVLIHDNGGTANGGVEVSASQTFTITVTSVNDVPSFTKGLDQTALEDGGVQSVANWATVISAGTNDSGQTVDFQLSNGNNSLFSTQPAISSTGTLTYTPAANANGTATVTVLIHDNGGTAGGGVDTSATQTFTITITPVNDAPSFTKGQDQTVLEDAVAQSVSNWATNISVGPGNESTQTPDFQLTNSNNSLFSVQPAIAANGTLTYTLAANQNGTATVTVLIHDNGGMANGGVEVSASQTFTITVTAVNDEPTFTVGGTQTALEDGGAQNVANFVSGIGISAGPNEATQTVDFQLSNGNNSLFSVQPAIAANGTLTYTPTANANGSTTVTVLIHDNGGTSGGGDDTSATQTFTITITPVNDVPSFTKGQDQTVLEDAVVPGVTNWATNISAGLNEPLGAVLPNQTVDFQLINNNTGLFTLLGQPAISSTGTLTYTLAPDANGTATVTVLIHDNGGTANGGVEVSASQTFTITVAAVNDVPVFLKGADQGVTGQLVLEDAGAQSVASWATAISAGTNEATQAVDFQLSNDKTSLFSVQPAVSTTGTLTYTPAANQSGTATVTVLIHDNGGTVGGGVDTSATQTFTITITPVNDVPSFTKGQDQTVLEDAVAQSITNWATNISAGTNDAEQVVDFQLTNNNAGLFSVAPAISSSGTLTYTLAPNANGTATVTVLIHDNGGTANGGVEVSASQTFTITVAAVNDVPSFAKGPNQKVIVNSGAQTVTSWATGILAGPADESTQTLNFLVTTDKPALFSAPPTIAANGNLTYTPATNAKGTATVTVQIHDNGGTINGGVDTSAIQTFTITIGNGPLPVVANVVYTAKGSARLRAFVVDGLLTVQINGVPYPTYAPDGIESLTIIGGSGVDQIDLSGLLNTVYSKLSTIVIKGGSGNDRIVGSFANDSIDAGAGNDTVSGGLGDDLIQGGAGTDLLIESSDVDFALTNNSLVGGLGTDTLLTIENVSLTGGEGDNTIDASEFTKGAVTLIGGLGNDILSGGTGNDAISGQDGDDELSGGKGNDTLLGGFGSDALNGDAGNDLLIGGFDDDTLNGGDGRDTAVGGQGATARGGKGVADDGDAMIMNSEVINEAFKKLFAFE